MEFCGMLKKNIMYMSQAWFVKSLALFHAIIFQVTYIILYVMNCIPGLSLRADIDVERAGLDQAELGFNCYEYVEDVKSGSQIQFGNFAPETKGNEYPAYKQQGIESMVMREQTSFSERLWISAKTTQNITLSHAQIENTQIFRHSIYIFMFTQMYYKWTQNISLPT